MSKSFLIILYSLLQKTISLPRNLLRTNSFCPLSSSKNIKKFDAKVSKIWSNATKKKSFDIDILGEREQNGPKQLFSAVTKILKGERTLKWKHRFYSKFGKTRKRCSHRKCKGKKDYFEERFFCFWYLYLPFPRLFALDVPLLIDRI